MQGRRQEIHYPEILLPAFFLRSLECLNASTISLIFSISFFFEDFFNAAKVQINI